jgi:hypothetical protein
MAMLVSKAHRVTVLVVAAVISLSGNAGTISWYETPISGQGTWETTLHARDVDGDGTVDAYYDSVLDITWLADPAYAINAGLYGVPENDPSGANPRYALTRADAGGFINHLNNTTHLGAMNWRLPHYDVTLYGNCYYTVYIADNTESQHCGINVDLDVSELAHMYYATLGNLSLKNGYDENGNDLIQPGGGLTNTGPFRMPAPVNARTFYHAERYKNQWDKPYGVSFYHGSVGRTFWADNGAWAVRDGDLLPEATVPPQVSVQVDASNDRVERIYNLNVGGVLYNVYFDKSEGGNEFHEDSAGAQLAIEAINAVLNDGAYDEVDNGHPEATPIYYVIFNATFGAYYSSCRSGVISGCNLAWTGNGSGSGTLGEPNPIAYFAPVTVAQIDLDPDSEANEVYPITASRIHVGILTTPEFDAQQVDADSLALGAGLAPVIRTPEMVELDGEPGLDMLATFDTRDTDILCADTEITLSGESFTEGAFSGADSISTDCVERECHP